SRPRRTSPGSVTRPPGLWQGPKSLASSTSRPTPSRPTCATCTPSSAPTTGPRPSPGPATWAYSHPLPVALGKPSSPTPSDPGGNHLDRVIAAHTAGGQAGDHHRLF